MSALDKILALKSETFAEAKKDTVTEIMEFSSGRKFIQEKVPVVPGEGAGFTTSFKAGFVEDLPTKFRILARAKFPDDPDAIERFGVIGGDIVFVNQDGELERATGGFADIAGSGLALAPEIAGSVIGTFATGSPLIGGAVGAVGGRALKEIIGGLVFEDPKTPGGVALNLAIEAGTDIAAGGIGKVVTKIAGRRGIAGVTDIDAVGTAAKREATAKATGIELDLAQITNLPKIKALKLWVRNFPGEAAEIVKANDDLIAGQVDEAIERVVNSVSRTTDTATLGLKGINAAEASISAARAEVAAKAAPLYKQSFQEGAQVNVQPVVELIESKLKAAKGAQATALKKALSLLKISGKKNVDTSIQGLHATKLALDEMLEKRGSTALGRTTKRDIVKVKEVLLEQMSEASPTYNQAREVFAAESQRLVEPLRNSIVGVLAQMPDVKASRAAAALFNGGNVTPQSIRAARKAIQSLEKTSPEFEGAWNGLVRQWLEDQFVRASRELQTGEAVNVAGKFRQRVIGTRAQKEAMNEALGPEAKELFDITMDALEMVSRTPTASSATEFNRLITEELKGSVGSLTRAALQPKVTIIRAIDENFLQTQAVKIAEALTDPAKVAQLKLLKELKPSTESIVIAASIIGLSILPRNAAGNLLFPEGTQIPAILQQIQDVEENKDTQDE